METESRQCAWCEKTKPVTDFYFDSAVRTKRQTHCKKCHNSRIRMNPPRGRGCRDQLAQIGLEVAALFPGALAKGSHDGQLIADVTCRLLREHARKAVVA